MGHFDSPTPVTTWTGWRARATLALVLLVAAPALAAHVSSTAEAAPDRVELRDGTVLAGRFIEDTGRTIVFHVDDEERPRKLRYREIARLYPTFEEVVLDLAAEPLWSEERVAATIEEYFTEEQEVRVERSDHYILFTTSAANTKKFVARDMETIYESFRETFPFEEPEGLPLMPVYLLRDHDEYARWSMKPTGWDYETAARSAGHAGSGYYATYYTGKATTDSTVWHEAGHQLVHERLRIHGGGSWFQEGMAVYFEDTWTKSQRLKSGMNSPAYTPFRELFEVPSLLHSAGDSSKGSIAGQRYRQAGTIIYFLAEGPWKERFGAFLEKVKNYRKGGQGRTKVARSMWDEIFMAVYQKDVDGVEAEWKSFFKL